jgi:hypothetical protein
MGSRVPQRWASFVAISASVLFLLDLFLDWQKAAVHVAGVVNVESTASGWDGWGVVAGVLAVLVVTFAFKSMLPRAFAAALGMFAATAIDAFTGSANVSPPAGPVSVVASTLWAAWLGLALAAIAVVATAAPLFGMLDSRTPSGIAPHGTA